MLCDEESEDCAESSSNNLDSALHELGMLSTLTNTSNNYFHETRRKSFGSKPNCYVQKRVPSNVDNSMILHQNSRYVSNVYTVGFRKKRKMKKNYSSRISPYLIPERIRTRSENFDSVNSGCKLDADNSQDVWMEHSSNYVSVLDTNIGYPSNDVLQPRLKKSRSLESIRVENIEGSQPSHEMEFVSSRIQKLKVKE